MTMHDAFTAYIADRQRAFLRPHLGFTLKTAANDHSPLCSCIRCEWTPPRDIRCGKCGRTHCSCGDAA